MKSVDGFELEGVDDRGRAVGVSISEAGQVVMKTPLVEGRGPFSSLVKRKTLVSLVENPPFEGQLRIRLIEERLGDSTRHVLDCRKIPPLSSSEFIFFTAPLSPEATILKYPLEWERELPQEEAREILKVLEGTHPPLACEDGGEWLDGTGYGLRMFRGSFEIRVYWQVQAPRGWKSLEIVAKIMRSRAQVEPAIQKLTEGARARVANKLRKEYAEANLVRKRKEAEDRARQNQKIRLLYESHRVSGMTCPHCGMRSLSFRFFDASPGGKSHLVCPECGRSIWGDDPRLPVG